MELIEGDIPAERIKTGSMPVEEALKLALQITQALEAAHEKGIIHRDLKPANIKVTPEVKIKVLDFGLAKVFVGDQSGGKPGGGGEHQAFCPSYPSLQETQIIIERRRVHYNT